MSFFNMGNSRQSARAELPPKTRHLPAAAPGHVVARDRLPDRAPAPHGPDSLRSSTTDAVLAPPVSTNAVIDSLDNVPQHSAVLTAGDSRSVMRLPREIERFLCALELGAQRALILFAPTGPAEVRTNLQTLRAKLLAAGFTMDRLERSATSEVIQLIQENYNARQAGADGRTSTVSPSRAKALFEGWVDYAAGSGATDVHIVIHQSQARAYVRIHGELELIKDEHGGTYTAHMAESACGWAFNNAAGTGTNSESQFGAGDNAYCMITPRHIGTQQIALRYQSLRGQHGPKVVCRLLNVDLEQPTRTYEELGYSESHCDLLRHAAHIPAGFLLFAGITGSGKTTTLKTYIETHPQNGSAAFYSIEDPVEYPLRGVHQINLQRDLIDRAGSAAKYAEVVAGLMRADPDGVLMGEIRDPASAISGQQIVETGHMAAGTVHAHLISSIIPRLTNDEIGMSRQTLTNPNMLTLLCYQALVPVLCPYCRTRAPELPKSDPEFGHVSSIMSAIDERFKLNGNRFFLRNPMGCVKCNHRGTVGLTVVAEMLMPDRKWLQLTRDMQDYEAVLHYRSFSDGDLTSANMTGKTVFEHALHKALNGEIDPRQCERFDSFRRYEILSSHV